jgi:hypothetical protein
MSHCGFEKSDNLPYGENIMIKNKKIKFIVLFLLIILGNLIEMNSVNAMENKRFEQDIQDQQRLGRGNPMPLIYNQPARGGGQVHQQTPLQRDLDVHQRGGNPMPLIYNQPARGGGQVHHIIPNPIYNMPDYNGSDEEYPDPRSKKQQQYDEEVYDFGKRNYPKSNTFKGEYSSSDSDS